MLKLCLRTTLVCSLATLGGGCVLSLTTDGTPLDQETVETIRIGESTRADVKRLLGPPDEIIFSNREHDPLFERAFIFHRIRTKQSAFFMIIFSTNRRDTRYDRVVVFFDDKGVVDSVGSRLDAETASYGPPW